MKRLNKVLIAPVSNSKVTALFWSRSKDVSIMAFFPLILLTIILKDLNVLIRNLSTVRINELKLKL